ncbi:MAG: amino acid permease [Deltaproteobacteria bacterium]|nr:amino acid permease [Deltaproteobacteria bacterium]
MKLIVLSLLNIGLVVLFLYLFRQRNLLSYSQGGRIWLTFLAIGVITLMDEFTSIFYVPAEAYRFIGLSAIPFIVITSLLIRFISTRLTEIAEILEHHQLIGGGVYSFSYLVLGPMVSFVAVASIMVDYILTACISAVSAVLNATSFFPLGSSTAMVVVLAIIWFVASLNILGIKENVRFTFMIFIGAAFIMINLIASGLLNLDLGSLGQLRLATSQAVKQINAGSFIGDYSRFISSIAFCILAYSGVESVLQTAGFVRSWKEIRKAYLFLALTVGVVTPLVSVLVLSTGIDFKAHEGDLITHYATLLSGLPFGFMASAVFFSIIIFLTSGSQTELANMYALGLLASFCINMGSLILYRYFKGKAEGMTYSTSRLGTLILWIILVSCFIFLAVDKPRATLLWGSVTGVMLLLGFWVARKRSPETKEIEQGENEMAMILYLAESEKRDIHLFFRRSQEAEKTEPKDNEAYITFYSPRVGGLPPKTVPNQFRFPLLKISLFHRLVALLRVVEFEMADRQITVHLGWPMSSWWERLSIGVMVFNLMKLPRLFPVFDFEILYNRDPTSVPATIHSSPKGEVERRKDHETF